MKKFFIAATIVALAMLAVTPVAAQRNTLWKFVGSLKPVVSSWRIDAPGGMSGASLTVSNQQSCLNGLTTDANGLVDGCAGAAASGSFGTGNVITIGDNRYVETAGDTMTGALTVNVTSGTKDTLSIEADGVISGATLHAQDALTSSGTLSIEGSTATFRNVAYTMPANDGSASGDVLATDASGELMWMTDHMRKLVNGTFRESFNATTTSNGSTITMSLEQSGGGDLTMQFSDGDTILDTTPAATIELTAGSDTSPTENYIYIPQSTKVLTKSTSDWPSAEHIRVGFFLAQSAATAKTNSGVYINQNWNDHLTDTNSQGHITHMGERSRYLGAVYHSGIDGNGDASTYIDRTAGTPDTSYIKSTAGVVMQIHRHTVPAYDTSGTDMFLIPNSSVANYEQGQDLYNFLVDADGDTMVNKYYNLVLWGVANKTNEFAPLMINLPTCSYNLLASAQQDTNGCDVFSMPGAFNLESTNGFLIARLTMLHSSANGGDLTLQSTVDLRGTTPTTVKGGSAAGALVNFPDNQFTVFDEADATKILALDVGTRVTTGNTRTLQVPDKSGVIALTSDLTSTGSLQGAFDDRYVLEQGDTMTGGLIGTTVQMSTSIASSGTLVWEGAASGATLYVGGGITGDLTGEVTGNASTATALAANGGNCGAGEYPLGVDQNGAVESCTDATTEINSEIGNVLDATDNFTQIQLNGVTYTFPPADGSATGRVLKTDSAGQLSWSTDNDSGSISAGQGLSLAGSVMSLTPSHSGTTIQATTTLASSGTLVFEGAGSGASLYVAGALTILEGNLADSTIVSADILDGTIAVADLAAATYAKDLVATSPVTVNGTTNVDNIMIGADGDVTIAVGDAAADGSTKGIASFDAGDFDATSGNITITDDGHAHTTTSISGLDISDDTNLSVGQGLTLTGDVVSLTAAHSGTIINATSTLSSSGTLVWEGTASGAIIRGLGLVDCDADNQTLSWDTTTGKFGCGDDDSGGAGGIVDYYVRTGGDTMTGALIINVTGGTKDTVQLETIGVASGTTLYAKDSLSSSGVLVVDGTSAVVATLRSSISGATQGTYLDFYNNSNGRFGLGLNSSTHSVGSGAIIWNYDADGKLRFGANNSEVALWSNSELLFNEDTNDTNFRIQGDGDANLFFLDAGLDSIGIGDGTPLTKLDVAGGISGTALKITGIANFGSTVTITEGAITDGTITSADIKDSDIVTGDIAADTITHANIADADQADTKCAYIENPVAESFVSFWANKTANDFQITEYWAESDQTISVDLQVDDGDPADCDSSPITPAAGEAEDTSIDGDCLVAAGEELDLVLTDPSGTPTRVSICFTGNWSD